jgi:nucleoside-diphosphate-sugar epimerase
MGADGAVLVTGASGFLGRLVAATLLANEGVEVVLPIRDKHTSVGVAAALATELRALGARPELLERAHVVPLPPLSELDRMLPLFREFGIREIAHCAGCLSYYNAAKLKAGNLDFTRGLLQLGERASIRRFFYLSTAFASGLVDGVVRETLHEGSGSDPTEYMRSKRDTEWIVARSGLPYVILRPAIVIGDSRDGRYIGKPYGLYQLWSAAEKFGSQRYLPIVYAIAPRIPLQVVHQNAFQQSFLALRRQKANNVIAHITGREETLPTVRDLWDLWLHNWVRPREIFYYDRLEDVPLDELDQDERLMVEFAGANIEISTHYWRFETRVLDGLRASGLAFDDATVSSVELCQRRFMANSDRIQEFIARHRDKLDHQPRIVENYAATSA